LNKDLALSFLYDIWEKLPQGSTLTEAAADLYTSVEGIIDAIYLAAKDLNKITREEIEELIDIKQLGKLDPIIAWISGIKITDKDKSEDKSEDNKNGDEIKKK
ncbi:MAG: hypothetical protein KKD77_20610, partial [Gammaproteobacteria bacterium]|nr:hypothetical protein [Gammaproteobacteria bacterium]